MSGAPLLLLIVATSYLAAHVLFDRLAKRFSLVSGAEYLVLGLVLGPGATNLLPSSAVDNFSPLMTLGLGWIGALAGAGLAIPILVRTPAMLYRVALAESTVAALVLGGVEYALLHWGMGVAAGEAAVVAAALALVALPGPAAGVRVVAEGSGERDPVVRQLDVAIPTQNVLASAGLAVLFAILHATPTKLERALVPTEWIGITLAIGIVGGTLFHVFVGDEKKPDRLFVSLAGAIMLVSGAAASLRLSPVFAALVFGIILGNTRSNRAEFMSALRRVERPFYFALLIFAGASWQPGDNDWILPVAAFVVVRPFARIGAARIGARLNGALPTLGPNWGRGLIGHGGFALALALDYVRQGSMPSGTLVFTAAIVSLLLTDIISARFIRSVVRPAARHVTGDGPVQ